MTYVQWLVIGAISVMLLMALIGQGWQLWERLQVRRDKRKVEGLRKGKP